MSFMIVGSGVVGLTLSCALKSRGVSVRVFDKRKDNSEYPEYRIRISEKGRNSLQKILPETVYNNILKCSIKTTNSFVTTYCDAKTLKPLDFPTVKDKESHIISSSNLIKILSQDIDVEFNKNYVGYIDKENEVMASFEGIRPIAAKFVVGCDGINSKVRKQLAAEHFTSIYETFDSGYRSIEGIADMKSSKLELGNNLLEQPLIGIGSNDHVINVLQNFEHKRGVTTRWKLSFVDESYRGELEHKLYSNDKYLIKQYCLENTASFHPQFIEIIKRTPITHIDNPQQLLCNVLFKPRERIFLLGESAYSVPVFDFDSENNYFEDIEKFLNLLPADNSFSKTLASDNYKIMSKKAYHDAVRYQNDLDTAHKKNQSLMDKIKQFFTKKH